MGCISTSILNRGHSGHSVYTQWDIDPRSGPVADPTAASFNHITTVELSSPTDLSSTTNLCNGTNLINATSPCNATKHAHENSGPKDYIWVLLLAAGPLLGLALMVLLFLYWKVVKPFCEWLNRIVPRLDLRENFRVVFNRTVPTLDLRDNLSVIFPSEKYEGSRYLRETQEEPQTCCICLQCFSERENVRTLPCKHVFHSDCIRTWLTKYKQRCPMCNLDIQASLPAVPPPAATRTS